MATLSLFRQQLLRRNAGAGSAISRALSSILSNAPTSPLYLEATNPSPRSEDSGMTVNTVNDSSLSLFSLGARGSVDVVLFTPMDHVNPRYMDEMAKAERTLDMADDVAEADGNAEAMSWAVWLSSTLKKRRSKMNKHKLKKRRKKLRAQNKK